jgi:hypothetical protein
MAGLIVDKYKNELVHAKQPALNESIRLTKEKAGERFGQGNNNSSNNKNN